MPAAASASTAFGARAAAAAPPVSAGKRLVPVNRIGIQLFTVRDKVSSLGFRAVFEELANIGYSEIEFAGYTRARSARSPRSRSVSCSTTTASARPGHTST